jgi:lipoate-protein ligase A
VSELLVWIDGPADGPTNMAADEVLAAESVRLDRPLIRFYRWSSMTFSLGGFQSVAQARAEPSIASLPFVRRPSGGGGIIHGSDLTYAVAVPREHPWGTRPQVLYDAFHEALARTLIVRGIPAGLHPGRGPDARDEQRLFCFQRRARGDLVVPGPTDDGHKILGSAQRRLSAAVLQHGSLLLDTPRWNGCSAAYLGLSDVFPKAREWSQDGVIADWLDALSRRTGGAGVVLAGPFVEGFGAAIGCLSNRYRDPGWLERR